MVVAKHFHSTTKETIWTYAWNYQELSWIWRWFYSPVVEKRNISWDYIGSLSAKGGGKREERLQLFLLKLRLNTLSLSGDSFYCSVKKLFHLSVDKKNLYFLKTDQSDMKRQLSLLRFSSTLSDHCYTFTVLLFHTFISKEQ